MSDQARTIELGRLVARVCYLFKWPPRVPLREMSLDQVWLFHEYGREAQDMEARRIALHVLGAWGGVKDKTTPPKIVTERDATRQPADEAAIDRFIGRHRTKRGR